MAYVGAIQSLFSHNLGKKFGHKGVLPVVTTEGPNTYTVYADAAVDIGPGNSHLVISDNDLERENPTLETV